MQISDCMKREVFSINQESTLRDAVIVFTQRHIGTLPVVDDDNKLVGLLQLRDMITQAMPDFVKLIVDLDFVTNFGAAEYRKPDAELLAEKVKTHMQPPESVDSSSGLLRASALLYKHDLHDLPVVNADGKLVGIASRVDIGTAFLRSWNVTQGGGL